MNASNALFRSHLMQQFAAAARTQSRPPLALAASENTRRQNVSSTSTRRTSTSSTSTTQIASSTLFTGQTNTHNNVTPSTKTVLYASKCPTSIQQDEEPNDNMNHHHSQQQHDTAATTTTKPMAMASSLQSLIQSRYTAVHFEPTTMMQPEHLKKALDRAIACARAAPNHHRTEPFFFKRCLGPSSFTQRLADIAARVVFLKKSQSDPLFAQAHANRKREKWNQIPAFLVTLVMSNQTLVERNEVDRVQDDQDDDDYTPLDFSPPQTERQLEDYAAACAAVQNILLSLHAEGIGTKWATGAVVKTPAFRSLFHLEPTDRVVGLIMVGGGSASDEKKSRKWQRREDLVQDF